MIKNYIRAMAVAATVGLLGGLSAATPVDPGDYTGSRTAGMGVTGTLPWSLPGVFQLGWNISQAGPLFHYAYSLNISEKNPSHILLELSDSITPENMNSVITNMQLNGSSIANPVPTLFDPPSPSNPGLPGPLYGMKIDFPFGSTSWLLTFDSTRQPVWGDFYSKDGTGAEGFVYAYNTGFGIDPPAGLLSYVPWIPTPDTHDVPVPEPSTYLLLMTALGLGAFITQRRRAKVGQEG